MDILLIILSMVVWFFIILFWWAKHIPMEKQEELFQNFIKDANEKIQELLSFIRQNFLVKPYFSCYENTMLLVNISLNSRSIQYQCIHCGKKMRAAAGTSKSSKGAEIWSSYLDIVNQYNSFSFRLGSSYKLMPLEFETILAPLPYEQTTRTPIPEAIRAEVWRRDQGLCVNCGSKENLQFDHIIPIAQGGATSVKNLQILCQSCNLSKSTKI
jgi:HNH endonuclease